MLKSLVGLSFVVLYANACKPAPVASNTNSLDNFAGANTDNDCVGINPIAGEANLALTQDLKEPYLSAIRRSLSAVPTELQRAFFRDLNGRILLSRDLMKDCEVSQVSDEMSCLGAKGDNSFAIYLKDTGIETENLRTIRNEVVRGVGKVVADVMTKIQASPDGVKQVANADFDATKAELALRFVADIKKSSKYKISAINPDQAGFGDAVFMELFDSAYCSDATRATLKDDFAETNELVGTFKDELMGVVASDAAPAVASASKAFGLYGRWGRGNGPVRQGVRNWANFRRSGGGIMNVRRFRSGGGYFGQNRVFGGRFSRR